MKLMTKAVAVLALLALFAFAPVMQAQDQKLSHFSVDASAMGFSGAAGASAATIAGGQVGITKRVAFGYEQVIIPSVDATYYLGTVNYTMPVASLLGKNLNSKLTFDSSKWSATFFGGLGVIRQSLLPGQQHIASTLGAGLNYAADNHITVQLISGQWLHANVAGPAGNQLVFTPNTAAISTGLRVGF